MWELSCGFLIAEFRRGICVVESLPWKICCRISVAGALFCGICGILVVETFCAILDVDSLLWDLCCGIVAVKTL